MGELPPNIYSDVLWENIPKIRPGNNRDNAAEAHHISITAMTSLPSPICWVTSLARCSGNANSFEYSL